jgi:DegV family protein with EDD domain
VVRIVTDTVAGLPLGMLSQLNIPLAPQYVVFGEQSFRDVFDLSAEEFYRRLAASHVMPTTSAPSAGDMQAIYQEVSRVSPGATIVSIHPSADVSGTIRAAEAARAMLPEVDIRVFDSRSASLGLGLMVLEAGRMASQGAAVVDILARLAVLRETMQVYFLVDTLEYLARGGRIGRAAHLLGTLLDIKPLLMMRDGVIEDCARYRTRPKAIAALAERVIGEVDGRSGLHLGVIHSADPVRAGQLAESLCGSLQPIETLVGELGPSIGVHVGPGVLGVCYYVEG